MTNRRMTGPAGVSHVGNRVVGGFGMMAFSEQGGREAGGGMVMQARQLGQLGCTGLKSEAGAMMKAWAARGKQWV